MFGRAAWPVPPVVARMRVGIVGGGLTGLALQHHLEARGIESLVFEAAAEPGGVIRSIEQDGRILDLGPQRTRLTPMVRTLLDDIGLNARWITASTRSLYTFRMGELRRVPTSIGDALSTRALSWRGKARALLEPLTTPPRPGESVAAYFERALGSEAATYLAEPFYAGLYASNPREMPVEYSLMRALDQINAGDSLLLAGLRKRFGDHTSPPVITFPEGLQELPHALYAAHEASVHLETPVQALQSTPDGYRLRTPESSVPVDRVILTTPAGISADLLSDIASETATALRALTYNPLVVVHLSANTGLSGAGAQLPFHAPFRTLGITWNASMFDRDGVYTSYLGGAKAPELLNWPDARLASVAASEFERITGHSAEVVHLARLQPGMPAYDASWSAFDRIDPPADLYLCGNYVARAGIPGRIREAARLAADLEAERESP